MDRSPAMEAEWSASNGFSIMSGSTPANRTLPDHMKKRCAWSESSDAMRDYHDREWGVPERDSRALWEKLILDGFQAGLAWLVILQKRDAFRAAFENFDPEAVARFGKADVTRLVKNDGLLPARAESEDA